MTRPDDFDMLALSHAEQMLVDRDAIGFSHAMHKLHAVAKGVPNVGRRSLQEIDALASDVFKQGFSTQLTGRAVKVFRRLDRAIAVPLYGEPSGSLLPTLTTSEWLERYAFI